MKPMINSLVVLYAIAWGNFGASIIIFTLIIRAFMIPLTIKQARQMKGLSELQPQMKKLQAQYPSDKRKLQQETMKLYKDNGVNPLGCLGPMIIQFPIWVGLFWAIRTTLSSTPEGLTKLSSHLYSWLDSVNSAIPIDSSFLWLTDMGAPDTGPTLALLVGLSMFFMQKMTTMPSMDARQAQTNRMMLWAMPLMFGFFTLSFPAGLALYWVVSNVAGIIIQGFITGWKPITSISSDLGKLFSKTRSDRLPVNENDNDNAKVIEENIDDKSTTKTRSSKEASTNEGTNRNNRRNGRRSDRNRTKRTRRRAAPNRSKRR
jgi:YidC/Oxa1 family membrane protein insertase